MRVFILTFVSIFLIAGPASAQLRPFEDIWEDIVGASEKPVATHALVDNIPINVNIADHVPLEGHSLILNAYKPLAGDMAEPLLIGQTRILLTGLTPDLGLVIAVPEPVTRDMEYALINGVIVNAQDQEVQISQSSQFYRGEGSVSLEMVAIDQYAPINGSDNIEFGTISGEMRLPKDAPEIMRGGTLNVELVERSHNDPVGSLEAILTSAKIDIDQAKAPFAFKLDYALPETTDKTRYLRAQIIDWAGRSVFETQSEEPFRGPDNNYKISVKPTLQP